MTLGLRSLQTKKQLLSIEYIFILSIWQEQKQVPHYVSGSVSSCFEKDGTTIHRKFVVTTF